ncbi:sigma factor-like helix-turn-helix DNA-binding protein, partial [Acinetobacter baumannii]
IDPADEQPQTLLVDRAADPERSAYGSELQRALHGHVNALPDAQREALRLVREEGLTNAEAAAVLGTSSAAVKLRVHRAYASLRSALARLIGE